MIMISPLPKWFGLESYETLSQGLLIKTSLDLVEDQLVESGAEISQNIFIDGHISGLGVLVFQLKNQEWTGLLEPSMTRYYENKAYAPSFWNWEDQAQFYASHFHTRSISYGVDDVGDCINYVCWDDGVEMERMMFDHSELDWEEYEDDENDPEDCLLTPYLFRSQLRSLNAQDIDDAYDFMDAFFKEQKTWAFTEFAHLGIKDLTEADLRNRAKEHPAIAQMLRMRLNYTEPRAAEVSDFIRVDFAHWV